MVKISWPRSGNQSFLIGRVLSIPFGVMVANSTTLIRVNTSDTCPSIRIIIPLTTWYATDHTTPDGTSGRPDITEATRWAVHAMDRPFKILEPA